jgi:hypothetical protein
MRLVVARAISGARSFRAADGCAMTFLEGADEILEVTPVFPDRSHTSARA